MTTGGSPYESPIPMNTSGSPTVLETTIVARHAMVDIGGVMAHAETLNGAIPGPTLKLNVGDTVIVRLINQMDHPTGIHWHGIELSNSSDGVEVTQEAVLPAFATPPPPPAPAGGTYLYKFKVTRPGIYWYHPHHHHSLNRVFRGMYGMIVVKDPNEAILPPGRLPADADTKQIVLSDITVCDTPGSNDAATYPDPTTQAQPAEWLSGQTSQGGPTPRALCEVPPTGSATDDQGSPLTATDPSYVAGDVPSIARAGLTNEGQTVLTNGVNVGARGGTPGAPGTLAAGAHQLNVTPGTGLRLQLANCATIRYFRLRLTDAAGTQIPLIRVGGEGGLLDRAVSEGGVVGGYDTKYGAGEILLAAGSRADVVAAIPATATGTLTLWTRDFQRTGPGPQNPNNWARLPSVPVMHLNVTGTAPATPYTIAPLDTLRASPGGALVTDLGAAATGSLLDPATFPSPQPGMPNDEIQITTTPPSFDTVLGDFEGFTPYSSAPHIMSSRWAEEGDVLELVVNNTTAAHHPFHLHGFSIQPISLTGPTTTYTWPYREFRDNVDIPANNVLTFRVRLDPRELKDGVTLGGALGRWLFHCHIFFHHHQGMISELVVSTPNGTEKPHVDVRGSWAYTPAGGTAQRFGTYWRRGGGAVNLSASVGTVTDTGGGTWSWTYPTMGVPAGTRYVYITGEAAGLRDQAVFRLKIGAPDDGADNGDPHVHTVDGKYYDFQGAGEFTLLRDWEGMEIQARHWPVQTANPITDPYTGLRTCVSVNTAVAARVGEHRISYQTGREGRELQLYVDGEPSKLSPEGMDVRGGHRISSYEANGQAGLRVDYANQAVLTVTPWFWNTYGIWLFNVNVSHTQAEEGIMGRIPPGTWLPALPSGTTVGPMPAGLHDRYVTLYETFANAWRVTDETSLFVYAEGESTKTYTDEHWPSEKPPCVPQSEFEVPGANPPAKGIPVKRAKEVCRAVKADGMNRDCVFDVATTGDEELAQMYLMEQELRLRSCSVQLVADKARTRPGEPLEVVATVLPLRHKGPKPTGEVSFLVDDGTAGEAVRLDKAGRATLTIEGLERGEHTIRAAYGGGGRSKHLECSSPTLVHVVEETRKGERKREVEPA